MPNQAQEDPRLQLETLEGSSSTMPENNYPSQVNNNTVFTPETFEVRNSNVPINEATSPTPILGSMPKQLRRRAALVSLIVTLLVVLLTGAVVLLVSRDLPLKFAARFNKQQDISLKDAVASTIPAELQSADKSVLVNGDLITKGDLSISNGGFVAILQAASLAGNQNISLPNSSGTVCLDSNNCKYADTNTVTALQAVVSNLQSQGGAIGAAGGDLTGTYPNPTIAADTITSAKIANGALIGADIANSTVTNANLVNDSLTVTAGNGLINGGSVALGGITTLEIGAGDGITVNADDIAVDATVCRTSGNCAGAGGGITGSGTSGQVAYFNGTGSITSSANFLFNGSDLTVAGIVSGNTLTSTVANGTAPFTVTSSTLVSNFNSDLLDGQHGSFYQDAGNLNAGVIASARVSGSYTGITGVGTIATGAWQGSALADAYLQDNITISSAGSVNWTALGSYPVACAAGSAVSTLADTPTCTAFAVGTTASYIQNQSASDQTADFRISGTGRANTSLISPIVDAISGTLTIGNTNATAINIGKTTSNITTTITGQTVVKPSTGNDSATAFVVQNAAGNFNLLAVDTINYTTNLRAGNDARTLGSELYPTNNFSADWTNTGWTVSPNTQATHNSGNTNSLTNNTVTIASASNYQVQFTISGTCGTGNLVVTMGGATLATLNGATTCTNPTNNVFSYVVTTSNTNKLAFAPASTWTGTISAVSIKQITGGYTPALVVKNLSGVANIEVRASNSTDNTFIGLNSGQYNTSGVQNTTLGANTLSKNTTGWGNVAVGAGSLQNNTTGLANDAVGLSALQNNTTGYGNDAFGFAALQNNTTGIYNTALGNTTLQNNTTGYGNIAVGSGALNVNTTGYYNLASGFNALTVNTTGYGNVALGASALASNTTGYNNVATGSNALFGNTTGIDNVATGSAALYTNTTGYSNTATGTNSLHNNTTGYSNTASGASSLNSNTTGYANVASGSNALYSNTTGHDNVANGASALLNNSTGYANVATGTSALASNTTGYYNTTIGFNSLVNNTTGYQNVATGTSALANNTTGQDNVANGVNSLFSNTIGSYNSSFGDAALLFNSSGDFNTALGYAAGANNTTGSSNTAIGTQAGYLDALGFFATSAALQRSTAIGAYAQVQANDSIVLGSVDNATKVGIGTTVPLNTFSIEPLDYQTGTATRTNGSATLVGTGTTWTAAMIGDQIVFADGTTKTISAFTDATHVTMSTTYTGTTDASPVRYRFHKTGLQVTSSGNVGIGTTNPTAPLHVVGNAVIAGTLTVTNATFNGTITINGHVITGNTSGSTTIAAGAAACTTPTVSISGNDTAGTITVTTGTGCAATGVMATITFSAAYGAAPRVVLTPANAASAALQYYRGSATGTFTLNTGTVPTNSTAYQYDYHVLQ